MPNKTISFDQAQYIAQEFHGGLHSALYSFASTGELHHFDATAYHGKVDALIATPHKFLVKDNERLAKLKRYFTIHKPLNK